MVCFGRAILLKGGRSTVALDGARAGIGWDRGWDVAKVFQEDVVSRYGAPFSSGHVGITKKHKLHRKICILHHKRTRAISNALLSGVNDAWL